ncbi:unnamed protein product [Ectocarpus sp. 12 AP-2014]
MASACPYPEPCRHLRDVLGRDHNGPQVRIGSSLSLRLCENLEGLCRYNAAQRTGAARTSEVGVGQTPRGSSLAGMGDITVDALPHAPSNAGTNATGLRPAPRSGAYLGRPTTLLRIENSSSIRL